MPQRPHALYRADDVRALDRLAIQEAGIPGYELMSRAGQSAFDELRRRWPRARCIAVFCGGGNNGGDGYVVARLAYEARLQVRVFACADPAHLQGDAARAYAEARAAGVLPAALPVDLADVDLVVDAILGTGAGGELRGTAREAVDLVNRSGKPVLALDVPSGLEPDTGRVLGAAVRAHATITFIGPKVGLFTGEGPEHAGAVLIEDLGVPPDVLARVPPAAVPLDAGVLSQLVPRRRTAHKGHFGHVLVVGGDLGMAGAARLAGEAALRSGAGLVSVATRNAHVAGLVAGRPELMVHGVESSEGLAPLLNRASVVAIGPGLGRNPWGRGLMAQVLDSHKPLVVDADALMFLAEEPMRRNDWVLTPHPGEAARLLGCTSQEIQADRLSAVAALQASFGGVVVLKGAGTLVSDGGTPGVCTLGNPGMASGGMGDVLTGIIAALIAQGFSPADAARLGVCLHGAAADTAAQEGERGLIASDLFAPVHRLANP